MNEKEKRKQADQPGRDSRIRSLITNLSDSVMLRHAEKLMSENSEENKEKNTEED